MLGANATMAGRAFAGSGTPTKVRSFSFFINQQKTILTFFAPSLVGGKEI